MTVETEGVPLLQKVRAMARGVGIVAFDASTFGHHLMDAPGGIWNHAFVALGTDLVGVLAEELPVGGGVGIVTLGTILRLNRSVDELVFQFFLKVAVTIEAELSRGTGLQFEFVLSVSQGDDQTWNDDGHHSEQPESSIHGIPLHPFIRNTTLPLFLKTFTS